MAKIVNEVGLSRTQKYPNYSVTMSWDRDCCVYRTVIKNNMIMNDSVKPEDQRELARFGLARTDDKPRGEAEFTQAIPRREGRRRKSNRTFKNAKVIHYFQSAKH